MFDVDGRLLYVGRTMHVESRFISHRNQKPWWSNVANVRLEHFPDAETLAAAEVVAIRSEDPLYNVRDRVTENRFRIPATPRKTPQRTIVVAADEWADLGLAAKAAGIGRAEVLRQFAKWFIGDPGVKKPVRPERHAWDKPRVEQP